MEIIKEVDRGEKTLTPTIILNELFPDYHLMQVDIIRPSHRFTYSDSLRRALYDPQLSRIIVISETPDNLYRYEIFRFDPDTQVQLKFRSIYHNNGNPISPDKNISIGHTRPASG